jgi:hypothetical protein
MTEQEKAYERAELEEIERAAKEAEHTATEDEGEEDEEPEEDEGVIHPDVEKQTDGHVPDYQAWAFEEDYTQRPNVGYEEEPEDAQLYLPARNMDTKPALGIFTDYVMMATLRRIWKAAKEKYDSSHKELVQMWEERGIRHDALGGNWPVMNGRDIMANNLPRALEWEDFERMHNERDRCQQHYCKYKHNKFCIQVVHQAIRMGYTPKWFDSDKTLLTEEGPQARIPLQKVLHAVTGCKYYAYYRTESPTSFGCTHINISHIIHGMSSSDVTTEFAKICLAQGIWLHPTLAEKGKRGLATEESQAKSAHPLRIKASDYAP